MTETCNKLNIKEEARALRKKTKRLEKSRSLIKIKSRKKGKIIQMQKDRLKELEENRDCHKIACKKEEAARIEAESKYKEMAALFGIKEEQLKEMLREFNELKKKYPITRLIQTKKNH